MLLSALSLYRGGERNGYNDGHTPDLVRDAFSTPSIQRAKSQRKNRTLFYALGIVLALASWAGAWFHTRYGAADSMRLPLKELSSADYPENPENRSVDYGRYANRSLKLIRKDATHFDFILRPSNPHTAAVVIRNVDVSLMVASRPAWTSENRNLEKIALTEREWNRQQVSFSRDSGHVEVTGGNGFETKNLYSAELANNSLNAGLWEILLYTNEVDGKKLYYQAWFNFPLGHYKNVFEAKTHLSYWRQWRRIEHWTSPEGTRTDLSVLREVKAQRQIPARLSPSMSPSPWRRTARQSENTHRAESSSPGETFFRVSPFASPASFLRDDTT